MKKLLIVAGEASGDLHGANLIKSILEIDPKVRLYGIGGSRMQSLGFNAVFDTRELAVVGIVEVLSKLHTIKKAFNKLKALLEDDSPDIVILIDYPEFNLRFAKEVKKKGIPVIYYISPQVWAWRKGRVKKIARLVDKMLVIFPFEVDIYKDAGMDVEYVGHPLVDEVRCKFSRNEARKHLDIQENKTIIAVAPGSRMSEIRNLSQAIMGAVRMIKREIPDAEFILPLANTLDRRVVESFFHAADIHIKIFENSMHEVVLAADAAIVASGTATLETAILETPMVVIYKVSPLTYWFGRILINLDCVSLVNIVANKKVVPELIQWNANPDNIAHEILKILKDKEIYNNILAGLQTVKERLGRGGASKRAAEIIYETLF
ncbi:MAG: lipid-A-disaccharide synthase [Deltaproteobacteria bacterium]|nr:lipid-A-disaccharide synthase [Deltaproteobacteria bacterium]